MKARSSTRATYPKPVEVQHAMSARKFTDYITDWQLLMEESVPDAFLAFDETNIQTQRMVASSLDGEAVQEFAALGQQMMHRREDIAVIIHLGIDDSLLNDGVPNSPACKLMLQIKSKTTGADENVYLLDWEPNPTLPGNDPNSIAEAIPAESAYLFVYAWLEKEFSELGTLFSATSGNVGQRVKSYAYNVEESKQIINQLSQHGSNAKAFIFLGASEPVQAHPYGFRPVLEVAANQTTQQRKESDGSGSSFFDFSAPCPPYCGKP